jgi:rhamnogalacturonyl hydrolase YesR
VPDTSSADPASIGIAILLANWTNLDGNGNRYGEAARGQLRYLFSEQVPKTGDGAISHKPERIQIWSDSVYMIPPFLAAYGVYTENKTIVEEAFQQVRLYRDLLRDERTGLWRHMVMGENPDSGFYATGELYTCVTCWRLS